MKKIILSVIISWLILFSGDTVFAAEGNFTVKTVIPTNQLDREKTYFDLRVSPGMTQDLTLVLKNNSSEEKIILLSANSATTNDNGVVEYGTREIEPDPTLKVSINDILTLPEQVVLPPNSEQPVTVHLKMPAKPFEGILLGGLTFHEKKAEVQQEMVENQYAYCVGILLSESDQLVEPELKLLQVQAGLENYRNVIQAKIQNSQSAMIKALNIKGAVYPKGRDQALYATAKNGLKMAPNSNFNFNISLNDQPLEPGDYLFKGEATADQKKWSFEQTFTISAQAAQEYNAQAVQLKASPHQFPMEYLLGALAITVGGLLFWLQQKRVKRGRKNG